MRINTTWEYIFTGCINFLGGIYRKVDTYRLDLFFFDQNICYVIIRSGNDSSVLNQQGHRMFLLVVAQNE